MKLSAALISTITASSLACFVPTSVAATACGHKNDIHCSYLTPIAQFTKGKYIKVKEVRPGQSTVTAIFCAATDGSPLMNIPQYKRVAYKAGENVSWQFSQCADEDCSTSKPLMDDKFQIMASGKALASTRPFTEVALDVKYGTDCVPADSLHRQAVDFHQGRSVMEEQVYDAAHMISVIPATLEGTSALLERMKAIAARACHGTGVESDKFQHLKQEIEDLQHVSTFDGSKRVTNGSLNVSIGWDSWNDSDSASLSVNLAPTDLNSLGLSSISISSLWSACEAVSQLEEAKTTVDSVLNGDSK